MPRAKTGTSQLVGAVEAGYQVPLAGTTNLTPFVRIQTGSLSRDALTESGAGILNLAAAGEQDSSASQSILGARFGTGVALGDMMVALDASLGWSHELGGRIRTASLSFAGTPGTSFAITGAGLLGRRRRFRPWPFHPRLRTGRGQPAL